MVFFDLKILIMFFHADNQARFFGLGILDLSLTLYLLLAGAIVGEAALLGLF